MSASSSCACMLEGNELDERLAAWRELTNLATESKVHRDRVTSLYPSDPALIARLQELIAAEGKCCNFLEFTVTTDPAGTTVEMTWPPGADELIESFLQRINPALDTDRSPSQHV